APNLAPPLCARLWKSRRSRCSRPHGCRRQVGHGGRAGRSGAGGVTKRLVAALAAEGSGLVALLELRAGVLVGVRARLGVEAAAEDQLLGLVAVEVARGDRVVAGAVGGAAIHAEVLAVGDDVLGGFGVLGVSGRVVARIGVGRAGVVDGVLGIGL